MTAQIHSRIEAERQKAAAEGMKLLLQGAQFEGVSWNRESGFRL
jgi:hypothetical protein